MTEDQARESWCPFVRLGSVNSNAHYEGFCWNNRGDDTHEANCIASDCMAWRWQPRIENKGDDMGRHGYCGLAGKP